MAVRLGLGGVKESEEAQAPHASGSGSAVPEARNSGCEEQCNRAATLSQTSFERLSVRCVQDVLRE